MGALSDLSEQERNRRKDMFSIQQKVYLDLSDTVDLGRNYIPGLDWPDVCSQWPQWLIPQWCFWFPGNRQYLY